MSTCFVKVPHVLGCSITDVRRKSVSEYSRSKFASQYCRQSFDSQLMLRYLRIRFATLFTKPTILWSRLLIFWLGGFFIVLCVMQKLFSRRDPCKQLNEFRKRSSRVRTRHIYSAAKIERKKDRYKKKNQKSAECSLCWLQGHLTNALRPCKSMLVCWNMVWKRLQHFLELAPTTPYYLATEFECGFKQGVVVGHNFIKVIQSVLPSYGGCHVMEIARPSQGWPHQ